MIDHHHPWLHHQQLKMSVSNDLFHLLGSRQSYHKKQTSKIHRSDPFYTDLSSKLLPRHILHEMNLWESKKIKQQNKESESNWGREVKLLLFLYTLTLPYQLSGLLGVELLIGQPKLFWYTLSSMNIRNIINGRQISSIVYLERLCTLWFFVISSWLHPNAQPLRTQTLLLQL